MLASILRDLGRWREAREAAAREWQTSHDPFARVHACLSLPMIPADEAEIVGARAELERGLGELEQAELTLPLDHLASLPTSFLLSITASTIAPFRPSWPASIAAPALR